MSRKLSVVAVETNLLGRTVVPQNQIDAPGGSVWPFCGRTAYTDEKAEVVACFVGDLDEAGALKFLLRGLTTGRLKECYPHCFNVEG